jgi:hypothetical protein
MNLDCKMFFFAILFFFFLLRRDFSCALNWACFVG